MAGHQFRAANPKLPDFKVRGLWVCTRSQLMSSLSSPDPQHSEPVSTEAQKETVSGAPNVASSFQGQG